jgi:glycyl-tRNA synthetase beta chain
LIEQSLALLEPKLTRPRTEVAGDVREFFRGRFVNLQAVDFAGDVVEAAVAVGCDDLVDTKARISALAEFKTHPDFEALAIGFKRAANIVKEGVDSSVDPALFTDPAERQLCEAFAGVKASVEEKVAGHAYLDALTEIATLRGPIDTFFEKVMVMAEDQQVRTNRLALLTGIARLVGSIADFSRLG